MTRREKYIAYLKTPHWKDLRNEKFKHNGHENCEVCSSHTRISVHHVYYKNLTDCTVHDLVALCWQCHEIFHAGSKFYGIPYHGVAVRDIAIQIDIFVNDPDAPYWVRKLKDTLNLNQFKVNAVELVVNEFYNSDRKGEKLDKLIADLTKIRAGGIYDSKTDSIVIPEA